MNELMFTRLKVSSGIGLACLALLTEAGCTTANSKTESAPVDRQVQAYTADLPFKMPAMQATSFPNKNFPIQNYGAVADGITENTDAFAKAIADCSKSGGGSVSVPTGVWLTGPIVLKSNVNLHLEKGALILFSPNREEYKKGANYSSLISGSGLHNVAVTGDGLINGSGEAWRPVKQEKMTASQWKNLLSSGGAVSDDGTIWAPTKELIDGQRPLLLDLQNCKSVLLDGPTFENSPSFAASISRDQDVVIRNTQVNNEWWAQNGDGLDVTSSKNVILYNCTVTAGDDAIGMKSSGTPGGANALENVVIADCVVYHGHGGFVVGSNTSGDIRNIYVENCNYIGTDTGIKFKSYVGGGGTVENIYFNNIHMKDIQTNAIDVSSYYQGHNAASDHAQPGDAKVPVFKNIHIHNVIVEGAAQAASIDTLPNIPLQNMELNNVTIFAQKGVVASNADGITLTNVKVTPKQGPVFDLSNSSNFVLDQVLCPTGTDTFIKLAGSKTTGIQLVNTSTSNAKTPIFRGSEVKSDAVHTN